MRTDQNEHATNINECLPNTNIFNQTPHFRWSVCVKPERVGPMFPNPYVTQSLYSPDAILNDTSLCSPVPMFPSPVFPSHYVPQGEFFNIRPYVPQYLCSPFPMFLKWNFRVLKYLKLHSWVK